MLSGCRIEGAYFVMKVTATSRRIMRVQNGLFLILLLLIVGLLAWLSSRYSVQSDWSANGRNTLSAATISLLSKMPEPVAITSYARDTPLLRKHISNLVAGYQRHKSNLRLEFLNPDLEPDRVRELRISVEGEMVIHYQGRTQQLREFNEQALSNALQRLARSNERTVVFLQGHGERDPQGDAAYDLLAWTRQLSDKGFQIKTLNLAQDAEVPVDTTLLVIASPQVELLAGEVGIINDYVAAGGHLLWLSDPGKLQSLKPLAEQLEVVFQPGTIIDPNIAQIGMTLFGTDDPRIALVVQYADHPLVENFAMNTLFPVAGSLAIKQNSLWRHDAFLKTMSNSWAETEQQTGQITFDIESDFAGPLTIALAISRALPAMESASSLSDKVIDEQRIVVVADGDFLSNAFLGMAGNQQLAMNIANWLSRDEQLISIPVKTSADTSLQLSDTEAALIGSVFLFVLPLGLVFSGVIIWHRRRKC